MKTQRLIYFILGLFLGLIMCYFLCCKQKGKSEEVIYPKVRVDLSTGKLLVTPMEDTTRFKNLGAEKVLMTVSSLDKDKNQGFIDAGFVSREYAYAAIAIEDSIPGLLDARAIQFDFSLVDKSGNILSSSGFRIADGIVWQDQIPMRNTGGTGGREGTYNCSTDNPITLEVLPSIGKVEVIWEKASDNCVVLNIEGDLLRFDFPSNAQSGTSGIPVVFTGAQGQNRNWSIDNGILKGTNSSRNTVNIVAARGSDERVSDLGSPVHGFVISHSLNTSLSVSGDRIVAHN